ncbi:All-trans-retinol dehydrogenase [NAD(+)] ADH4 [Fulvia fulva]|uniref:All-trans-retinol dehydrogenase [NAD(+)] ADH4 n=1 Tax=Passalora fulva TaxID=5499 RepID=A0A9Q8PMJ9_PASFU|nr:All-trans-retinol dehydrogenase [NAD(+)] ADH4 [Fulvia fulva]KAK4609357.1 All-trans-retinol dehydrogenase [NAD(+)] ADH4 [Fulvia fulva]KAK4609982.1 All-trans-retinol dehydrogenase [NAD(+)] ADH4 [Fulvia fulva]UJO25187.1 All-trans-retinol dehydrogenase [NAD(+)] ADH4 [Fulvia fulva]WPV22818.1 All-trans-retinol dehydrogenase [NAD(+)] ADH4 [Fulvia fulva]WPV37528.1 All-trans-retinol dehydrogenase [NAD(+)] ADH4 [Fulvia fulva]
MGRGADWEAGAGTVENILKPSPDSSILIFGLGTVGLTALIAAKYLGVKQIIGVDIDDHKLPLAKELGATDPLNSSKVADLPTSIRDLSNDLGVDYAIECTGVPSVIETMLTLLANRGTAVTVGLAPAGAQIKLDPQQFLMGSKAWLGRREGDSGPQKYIPHQL